MKYEIYLPCERLAPFVKHLAISESGDAGEYKILPDTAIVIGFQYQGRIGFINNDQHQLLANAGITGLLDSYRTFKNNDATGTVLVVFKETGVSHFIKLPVHELFRESLALTHFFPQQDINDITEQLEYANTDIERIHLVESFLVRHLNISQQDMLVSRALNYIHQSKGTIRISKLALALHTSQSPLEKRFRNHVGTSPKKFAGIVRVRSMISALDRGDMNMAEYLSSYYDQAHFIRDFARFTSLTPEQYLRLSRQKGKLK